MSEKDHEVPEEEDEVSDQLGLSPLLTKTLGLTEEQLLAGGEKLFHCAMTIDGIEEFLDQSDKYALFWLNGQFAGKPEGRDIFLENLEEDYWEAFSVFEETNSIEGIDRFFLDGIQYVYCYMAKEEVSKKTRTAAAKYFLGEDEQLHVASDLIAAHAIGTIARQIMEPPDDE